MKSDLDQLLKDNQADALWATGPAQHNPAVVYLTGGGHMTAAMCSRKLVKNQCYAMLPWNEMKRHARA